MSEPFNLDNIPPPAAPETALAAPQTAPNASEASTPQTPAPTPPGASVDVVANLRRILGPEAFWLLECLCILGNRVIKEAPDELGFVREALLCRELCERLVFLGTDVRSCQLGSGLSLIRHVC